MLCSSKKSIKNFYNILFSNTLPTFVNSQKKTHINKKNVTTRISFFFIEIHLASIFLESNTLIVKQLEFFTK